MAAIVYLVASAIASWIWSRRCAVSADRAIRALAGLVIWALLVHPGTSVSTLARLFHLPGSAVDWHALKSQLHRLAADRRLKAIVNGKRRKWIGWEVTP